MKKICFVAGCLALGLSIAHADETAQWQRAIDAAAARGGGRVTIPAGRHLVGQLDLRSNVEIHLSEGAASPLALFLACWRSPYLHALLPLEDVWLWGRNLLLCAALGLGTAAFSHQRRHGHRAWGWIPLALGAALLFPLPMGAFPFQGLDPAFLPYLETEVEVYTGSGSPVPGLMAFLLTGGSAAVLINAALMICGREPSYEN